MLDTVQYIFLENCRGIQCFNLGGYPRMNHSQSFIKKFSQGGEEIMIILRANP